MQVAAVAAVETLQAADQVYLELVAMVVVAVGLLEPQIAAAEEGGQTIQHLRIMGLQGVLVLLLLLTRTVTQQSLQSAAG